MSDLRTLFGQKLGQTPLDEEEFAKLNRLQRLWYYPVPKSYFDEALKWKPKNTTVPGAMDMPPVPQQFNHSMRNFENNRVDQSILRDLLSRTVEQEYKLKLTPEQKRQLYDHLITEPSIREFDQQRKKPRSI